MSQECSFAFDEDSVVRGALLVTGQRGGDIDGQPVFLHETGIDLARIERKGSGGQAVEEPGGTVADDVAIAAAADERLGEEGGAYCMPEAMV